MRKTSVFFLLFILFVSIACSLPFLAQETTVSSHTPTSTNEGKQEPSITPSLTVTVTKPAPQPELQATISEKQISEEVINPKYLLQVYYPFLEGVPRAALFNQRIEDFVNTEISSFIKTVEENEDWRKENMPEAGSDLRITYEITSQEGNLLSVLFSISFYTAGAAHPGFYVNSFNYNLALGQFVDLPELFKPGSSFLELISEYCIDELNKSGVMAWEDGAKPVLSNYKDWNTLEEGILISFDPYQVAPGAAGLLQVVVPFEVLQNEIQPDGLLSPLLD